MNKQEFLDALKRSLMGLPAETAAKTMAYYEQRFIDGAAAGKSEAEIALELDDPRKIAMTLRASAHLGAFEQRRNPANLARLLVSLVGLAVFNLFMVVPAAVYTALLASMYACAVAFYISGIAITASGLAGANELVIDGPLHQFISDDDGEANETLRQTKVSISSMGIHVFEEPAGDSHKDADGPRSARAEAKAMADSAKAALDAAKKAQSQWKAAALRAKAEALSAKVAAMDAKLAETEAMADADADYTPANSAQVIKRAEAVAGHGLRIYTDLDAGSRTTQAMVGIGIVVAGILLMLLSLVVTRFTLIGIKRYVEMNFSLLRGR